MIPAPSDVTKPVGVLVRELAGHLGDAAMLDLARDLLSGAEADPNHNVRRAAERALDLMAIRLDRVDL